MWQSPEVITEPDWTAYEIEQSPLFSPMTKVKKMDDTQITFVKVHKQSESPSF